MSISCEIIKDLLPLYHDGVCSKESRSAVEEHLSDCESCKAELKAMDEVLPINSLEQNLTEADAVKKLSRRWKMGMVISTLKGILITLLLACIIGAVMYLFMDIRIV